MTLSIEIPSYIILAGIAAFLVGLSKGGLPSIGMLGVPILSMAISPLKATVLLLPVFVLSDVIGVYLYRKEFSATNLKILIPSGVLGVAVGWAVAAYISETLLTLLIGLTGIVFCLNMWLRKPVLEARVPHSGVGVLCGGLAGFTSFISHSGAPPFQIYVLPQKLPKLVFAGTSTIFFAFINASKIIPYQQLQPYSFEKLLEASILVPFAIAGTFVGASLTKRINEKMFFLIVQVGLFAVSCKLVLGVL
jgi:uncharacterized membrane protein YfcA